MRSPDRADQLAHLVVHDRVEPELRHAGRFLLRSQIEGALLARDPDAAGQAHRRLTAVGRGHWLLAHLERARWSIPSLVVTTTKMRAAATLRERWRTLLELHVRNGPVLRLYWFFRPRLQDLRRSPEHRARLAVRLRSPAFHRYCLARMRDLLRGA